MDACCEAKSEEIEKLKADHKKVLKIVLTINVLLFIVAPLLLTNAIFIATGWATSPAACTDLVSMSSGEPRNRKRWRQC